MHSHVKCSMIVCLFGDVMCVFHLLAGVNLSLLSKVMSSKLSRGTYNGGLLSTEAGTLVSLCVFVYLCVSVQLNFGSGIPLVIDENYHVILSLPDKIQHILSPGNLWIKVLLIPSLPSSSVIEH